MTATSVLLVDTDDRIAIVTLNRPERRNALNAELLRAIRHTMAEVDADDAVDAIVVTGTDPAFCAGVDLKELGGGRNLVASNDGTNADASPGAPWAGTSKPVIGAINGAAVTGGLEIALRCDFLIASEKAAFADTHARVGIMPGWGLSVLLPQAVGIRKAKEMSLTGNFVDAHEAYRTGLVNRVVPHDELLPTARQVASDIAGNDQRAVRSLLASYDDVTSTTPAEGLQREAALAARWNSDDSVTGTVEERRRAIVERGRAQL